MSVIDNIKELEAKQKVMLVAIVILIGVALYMGYTTFFPSSGGSSAAPVRATVPQRPVAQAPATPKAAQPSPSAQSQRSQEQLQYLEKPKTSAPTPQQLAILAQSQQLQEEYVHLVSQYQIAQLEQKLATTNAAIAKQKLSATKSLVETQKLQGAFGQQGAGTAGATGTNTKAAGPAGPMQVMYVGRQSGLWSAMLGSNGSYFEVKVGTKLPDGTVVSSINSQGVTLNNSGRLVFLAIPKTLD